MIIKCKGSNKFLANINIEKYYANLKKMGIEVEMPLEIEFACRKCKCIEVYEIYPTHYTHIRSYKRDVDNNK